MNKIVVCGFFLLSLTLSLKQKAQVVNISSEAGAATPDQRKEAEDITKKMAKKYDLNDEQRTAFLMLNLKRVRSIAALRAGYDGSKATIEQKTKMKEALEEEQKRYDYVAKELMSDKQYAKYQAQIAKEREAAENKSGEKKIADFGPIVIGENTTNILGWGAQIDDTLKIAVRQTDKMVKQYKLTDSQSEKLLALNIAEVQAEIAERRAIAKGTNMGEITEAAKKRTSNYERYLKGILTEKQFNKYIKVKKAQVTLRQSRRGPGGLGGPRIW